jgi:hypothetical protein
MPSPFPGMNPFLEQDDVWHDFHQSFIPLAREVIGAQVGPDYLVKVEEQLFIHELSSDERRLLGRADVAVAGPQATAGVRPAVAVTEAPANGILPDAAEPP